MLSFKIFSTGLADDLVREVAEVMPDADLDLLRDNISIMIMDGSDTEYATSYADGCFLIRIFDGEYIFSFPLPLTSGADPIAACEKLRAYAVKEEIPLVIFDVPSEELGGLIPLFRHSNVDAADPDREFFTLRVMSEATLLGSLPTIEGRAGVSLTPLAPADDELFARLCKDADTNRYWGYDFSQDNPDPTDDYFRLVCEEELARGVAISLAVRVNDSFAGEATLYAFDLMGGCECAVRLLPAFRHKGYATEVIKMLGDLAADIGMVYLCATVAAENKASVRLSEKTLSDYTADGENLKFRKRLC